MIDGHEVTTTTTSRKLRIPADQRMAAKALLLAVGNGDLMRGGQLIIHFGPGRTPVFIELQERQEQFSQKVVDRVA